MHHRTLAGATLLTIANVSLTDASEKPLLEDINRTAHLLAGESVPGERGITRGRTWKSHQSAMESAWASYERSTLNVMSRWSREQVSPHLRSGGVVRYAFSGPDVLHVLHMFPEASTYILCGLEPVGSAPRSDVLRGRSAGHALAEVRKILEESVRFSFFKTKDMRVELANARYGGTLPIMSLFLARSGFDITHCEFIELSKDGKLRSLGTGVPTANAVRIDARSKRGGSKSFYYFRTNIADGSIDKSGFLAFLESLPPGGSYVKAASYLMHNSYFSKIRGHLLAHSRVLVQDDSGIPLRYFDRQGWQIGLYGSYSKPIPLFAERYQSDLRKAYRSAAKPLPFGTGYQWRKGTSNLMCAVHAGKKAAHRPAVAAVLRALPVDPPRREPGSPPTAEASPPEPPSPTRRGYVTREGSYDLTLKLVATSALENREAIGRSSAFVINEYSIQAVQRGPAELRGQRIRIANTSILHGRDLPQRPVGSVITIRVKPLATYPGLMRWHREDDLPKAGGAVLYIAAQS